MSQIPPIYGEQRSFPKPEIINGLEYSPGSVYQPPQADRSPGVVIAIALGGLTLVSLLLVALVAVGYQVIANVNRANDQQQPAVPTRTIIQQQATEQQLAKQKRQQEQAELRRQQDAAFSEVKRRVEQTQAEFNKAAERAKAEQQPLTPSDELLQEVIRRRNASRRIPTTPRDWRDLPGGGVSSPTAGKSYADKMIEDSRSQMEARLAESDARMKKMQEDSTRRMNDVLQQQRDRQDRLNRSLGMPPLPGR